MKLMRAPKDKFLHRLKIISGQLRALERMANEDRYCMDILTLSLAIQKALAETDRLVLEKHLNGCVVEEIKKGRPNKTIRELSQLFAASQKG